MTEETPAASRWDRFRRPVTVKVYQLVAILAILSVTWAAGIYGFWAWVSDYQDRACRERNETRDDVITGFVVTWDFLEGLGVEPATAEGAIAAVTRALADQTC